MLDYICRQVKGDEGNGWGRLGPQPWPGASSILHNGCSTPFPRTVCSTWKGLAPARSLLGAWAAWQRRAWAPGLLKAAETQPSSSRKSVARAHCSERMERPLQAENVAAMWDGGQLRWTSRHATASCWHKAHSGHVRGRRQSGGVVCRQCSFRCFASGPAVLCMKGQARGKLCAGSRAPLPLSLQDGARDLLGSLLLR